MQLTNIMFSNLERAAAKGLIVPRTENNKYLKVSYKGAGGDVPASWNVKIYTSGSVVTTDQQMLENISKGTLRPPDPRKVVIQVDDSGWGFPLCGVMVGVSDGRELMTGVVDVKWFKKGVFDSKGYLKEYSRLAQEILDEHFSAKPLTHRVEICAGFVNSTLKDDLRAAGFDVRVAEITGFLQDKLEGSFKEYVRVALGADLAFDPKAMASAGAIAKKYHAVLAWGRKNRPEMLKDGWSSMSKGAK